MSIETPPTTSTPNSPAVPPARPKRARRLPVGLVAWLVLLGSFSLFCLLVYFVYMQLSSYLSHSIQAQTAVAQGIKEQDGNVAVLHQGQAKEILVNGREEVSAGDEIRTDKTSTARLTFFDGSWLDLTPGSRVRLEQVEVETKKFQVREKHLQVTIEDGLVRLNVAPLGSYSQAVIKVFLPTDQGDGPPAEVIIPAENLPSTGLFLLSVSHSAESGVRATLDNQSPVTVEVNGSKGGVKVGPGQRVAVEQGQPGQPSRPGERQDELIVNGSFINGVDSWKDHYEQGSDQGQLNGAISFDAERIEDGVQPRARIFRLDPKAADDFAATSLTQEVNRDVSDYSELWFSLHLKLIYQNLAGGGQQGAEYPVYVKIDYLDSAGNRQQLFHGFYAKPTDSYSQDLDRLGQSTKLAQGEWEEWRINLMDNRNKPARILRVEVGSTGHLYDSYFTDISLAAR